MDLNRLLYHHQVSLMNAGPVASSEGPGASGLVRHYQTRIDRLRDEMGVLRYPAWCEPVAAIALRS